MLSMKEASPFTPPRLYCRLDILSNENTCTSPSNRLLALMRVAFSPPFSGLKDATMGFSELTFTAL